MRYRAVGKTGLQVSALAMGCMRLPEDDPETAARVVDEAIAAGVTYFETTRAYINGRCQHLTGGGLKGRSRGLMVSGKAAVNDDTTADSYRREIDLQMEILGVDYLEFFQVGWFRLKTMAALTREGGALEGLRRAQKEGLIGHLGFTGHDTPENYIEVVESGIFDCMTIPYSLLNRSYEPTIKRAGELGMGVVAMCPVAGGLLAAPSDALQKLLPGGSATTSEAALKFVLSNPDVSCACSGMNTLQQLEENVATATSFEGLSGPERAQVNAILDEFSNLQDEFCTGCGYCMDCPSGVDIPGNFKIHNYDQVYGLHDWAREQYAKMDPEKRAERCEDCGECEPKCPNEIPIRAQLQMVLERYP